MSIVILFVDVRCATNAVKHVRYSSRELLHASLYSNQYTSSTALDVAKLDVHNDSSVNSTSKTQVINFFLFYFNVRITGMLIFFIYVASANIACLLRRLYENCNSQKNAVYKNLEIRPK